jgi:DNA-binding MarR family transcriptional regulator
MAHDLKALKMSRVLSSDIVKIIVIRRAINRLATRHIKHLGLGPMQGGFIRHLSKAGKLSQAELSRLTDCDPAAASKAIEVLMKRGLLARHDHPTDRRRWEIALTDKGRNLDKEIEKAFDVVSKELARALTRKETAVFSKLLDKVLKSLNECKN